MHWLRRVVVAAPWAVGILGAAFGAEAGAPAASLVRLLESSRKPHPLADAAGRVPVTAALPAGTDAAAFGMLAIAPGIGGIALSPSDVDAFARAHPELALRTVPGLHTLIDYSKKWTHVDVYRGETGADGTGVAVGVVDTGIDILHPDFRDAAGKTRIKWLLHTAPPNGACHKDTAAGPCIEDTFGCNDPNQTPCVIYDAADLDAMIAQGTPDDALLDLEGHGTHVTSIAAGNGGPSAGTPKYIGMAPGASLIIADPELSGFGFADAGVLNATRFVFDRAAALNMPCVVNLSVGGDFGPHDGTSSLEAGLAAMVGDDKPGRAIVVAAGNSGTLYQTSDGRGPFGVHTEAHVSANAVTRVPILAPASHSGQIYVWITFNHGDQVSVALDGPGGSTWIGMTAPGSEAGYEKDGTTGAIINNVVDGKSSLTPDTDGAVIAVDGAWDAESEFAVRLQGEGEAELWVTGQADAEGASFERALRQGTINVPASHPNLLAVGCSVNRVEWQPLSGPPLKLTELGADADPQEDSICYFSSAGPTPFGVPKPEIVAPGAFVAAAMSHDADPRLVQGGMFDSSNCPTSDPCYLVDDRHAIAVGTSMSAPHVAGAVALLFQGHPTLTQAEVTEILQVGARYPSGKTGHDTQLGVGELDLEGARLAMQADSAIGQDPDPASSWFVLSSDYVRPDPTWPVWGTIQLRRADGSIASGLDGTRLSATATGGVTVQALTKVDHGTWRFAFAAARGTAGQEVEVAVRYAGQLLGVVRTLPISADAWQAQGTIEAEGGGCACEAAGGGSRGAPWALALAFVGLWMAKRRRRR